MTEQTTNLPARRGELSAKDTAAVTEIERIVTDCELALKDSAGKISRAFVMAKGIAALRKMITDEMMMEHIMPLMDTRLGFKTDRDPHRKDKNGEWNKPYSVAVVKECLIEAMLRGAYPVNNEFNIISSGAYLTKEYFTRAVGQIQGVSDVVPSPGIPIFEGQKAKIRFGLSWKHNGVPDCLKSGDGTPGRILEIRIDNYSTTDQVIGKATRKAYAAAYQQITGSATTLPDGDVTDAGQPLLTDDGDRKNATAELDAKIAEKSAKPTEKSAVSDAGEPKPQAPQKSAAAPPAPNTPEKPPEAPSAATTPQTAPEAALTGDEFGNAVKAKIASIVVDMSAEDIQAAWSKIKLNNSISRLNHRNAIWQAIVNDRMDLDIGKIVQPVAGNPPA